MTPYLHGNNEPCPACEMRRAIAAPCGIFRPEVPCNNFGGAGYVALSAADVAMATAAFARQHYWPAFDARVRAHAAFRRPSGSESDGQAADCAPKSA